MEYVSLTVPVDHPDFGKSFPCPRCKAPKLELAAIEGQKAKLKEIIVNSGLSKHHMHTFEEFWALPDQFRRGKEFAAQAAQSLAETKMLTIEDVTRPGLLLWGSYGTGKTTLATSAVLHVASEGIPVLRIKFADLMDRIQSSYSAVQIYLRQAKEGDEAPLTAEQIIKAAESSPFLMIDDLGDPLSGELTPDKRRIIHRIFEYRDENEMPTIVTSNLDEKSIRKQFSERTGERIFELCHKVEVTGQNLRT